MATEVYYIKNETINDKHIISYEGRITGGYFEYITNYIDEKYLPPVYMKDIMPNTKLINETINRISCPMFGRKDLLQEVWDLFDSKELTREDRYLLLTTFDNRFFKKEHIDFYINVLKEHLKNINIGNKGIIDIINERIEFLEEALTKDIYGVYFNEISVNCISDFACVYVDDNDWELLNEDEAIDVYEDLIEIENYLNK